MRFLPWSLIDLVGVALGTQEGSRQMIRSSVQIQGANNLSHLLKKCFVVN
jgi:hypothetical protein